MPRDHYGPWSDRLIPLSQSERKPAGHILLDTGDGWRTVADTLACAHCGKHFVSVRGSGHIRGWCTRCGAVTCGDPACDVCVSWERKMELIEAAAKGRILLPGQW